MDGGGRIDGQRSLRPQRPPLLHPYRAAQWIGPFWCERLTKSCSPVLNLWMGGIIWIQALPVSHDAGLLAGCPIQLSEKI
ncbi:hypothetical protein BO86DRAFT_53563 [Aspergillus japonicus CBS 114.51]|uniref:Uncharacterized protein n=1 Tax=Aspergillus japonicus CBS 114.51 TaxID=1448312 RepID=A0A8T8X541_ASPJA|nr:hypothetical protein BO86DRAFT_53563 [Aspergillus japonicus CBS 114.51]RAH83186.1 hypothetical protein BO86DRAFT_53563 [Aspergillus japonicus CBS 114.51]